MIFIVERDFLRQSFGESIVQRGFEVRGRVAKQLFGKVEDSGRAPCSDSNFRKGACDIVSENSRQLTLAVL
jgi:hypothetical protein